MLFRKKDQASLYLTSRTGDVMGESNREKNLSISSITTGNLAKANETRRALDKLGDAQIRLKTRTASAEQTDQDVWRILETLDTHTGLNSQRTHNAIRDAIQQAVGERQAELETMAVKLARAEESVRELKAKLKSKASE